MKKQVQMHGKIYKLHFTNHQVPVLATNLSECIEKVFEENEDPLFIERPEGDVLIWNAYIANVFTSKGRITEQQFIDYSRKEAAV
jgi:hypothetical protein